MKDNWSESLTVDKLLKEAMHNADLITLLQEAKVGDELYLKAFRRMLDTVPTTATLRVGSQGALMVSMEGWSVVIDTYVSATASRSTVKEIDALLIDRWPDYISRALANLQIDTNLPLILSESGLTYEVRTGWTVSQVADTVTLVNRPITGRKLELHITVSPFVVTTPQESLYNTPVLNLT
jgi:hypothetical protein